MLVKVLDFRLEHVHCFLNFRGLNGVVLQLCACVLLVVDFLDIVVEVAPVHVGVVRGKDHLFLQFQGDLGLLDQGLLDVGLELYLVTHHLVVAFAVLYD